MATNSGWPEAFGFSMSYGRPCIVDWVEDGGSAEKSGLQVGDVVVEVDGEDVREWSIQEVIERAQISHKVPPSLLVKSHVKLFEIPISRDRPGALGLSLRGNSPVYVRSVEFDGLAHRMGMRSGDLILEVNGTNVRYYSKEEVLELISWSEDMLSIVVVMEGLQTLHSNNIRRKLKNKRSSGQFNEKLKLLFKQDEQKKKQILVLLDHYNTNRDIEGLGRGLYMLLETPTERELLNDIRSLIQPSDLIRFDLLLSYERPHSVTQRSLPKSRDSYTEDNLRLLEICRGPNGEYGFSLSGNSPVFVRSVDTASPASISGIIPDDYILEINGEDTRNATHSQVVQLLKDAGPTPQLLVSQNPSPTTNLIKAIPLPSTDMSITNIKEKMNAILTKTDKQMVKQSISNYSKTQDLGKMVNEIVQIASNDPQKNIVFQYIRHLLPEQCHAEFEILISNALGKIPFNSTIVNQNRCHSITFAGTLHGGSVVTKRQSTLRDTKISPVLKKHELLSNCMCLSFITVKQTCL
jgi:C-terminal processing protease CtpA/Prc